MPKLRNLLLLLPVLLLPALIPPPEPASAFPTPTTSLPFPRTFCYGTINTAGRPFLRYRAPHLTAPTPPYDTTLDTAFIRLASRFDIIALHANPILPYRPDILVALRRYNPSIKIVAYLTVGHTYASTTPPGNEKDFQTLWYEGVNAKDSFVYCSAHPGERWVDADPAFANSEVDFARPLVADSLARLIIQTIVSKDTTFDGVFLDTFSPDFAWMNTYNGHTIDYARAGHASLAAMDAQRERNCKYIIDTLRSVAPSNFIIMANGPADDAMRLYADGWLWEGFPNQAYGGSGWDAMYLQFRQQDNEPYPILKEESGWNGTKYNSTSQQEYRFVLGTACLGSGFASIGPDTQLEAPTYLAFPGWWYDEGSVTHYRDGGRTDTTGAYAGWLGLPLGRAQKLSNGCYKREFVNGLVLVNPTSSQKTISLNKSYTRILGVRNPTTNNGTTASSFTLQASDALFLLTPVCRR